MNTENLKIAVVGGGVAGITAAYLLQRRHRVTIFERNEYLGGHTHTIDIPEGPDAGLPVDTGFIVFNDHTYPTFRKLLASLKVEARKTDMSFSFYAEEAAFFYAGTNLNGLFAQRRNLLRPWFHGMLREIVRFSRRLRRALHAGSLGSQTLRQFLAQEGISRPCVEFYVIPMASAIWSMAPSEILDFPAATFSRFFENHGLLSTENRPQWMTVQGGSHAYVKAFMRDFRGEIRLDAPVAGIRRDAAGVAVTVERVAPQHFDAVVVAAHADEALRMLADPTADESRLLGAWRYQHNRTVLHTHTAVLPPVRRAWACWNYTREKGAAPDGPAHVTYYMNRLQGLRAMQDYCVSLNRAAPIPKDAVIAEMDYAHPTYTEASVATQAELSRLNAGPRTCFCGSYFGYGFHEDAVKAGAAAAKVWGLEL